MNCIGLKRGLILTIIIGITITFNAPLWADPYADQVVKFFDGRNGFKGGWDINGNHRIDYGEPMNVPVAPGVA